MHDIHTRKVSGRRFRYRQLGLCDMSLTNHLLIYVNKQCHQFHISQTYDCHNSQLSNLADSRKTARWDFLPENALLCVHSHELVIIIVQSFENGKRQDAAAENAKMFFVSWQVNLQLYQLFVLNYSMVTEKSHHTSCDFTCNIYIFISPKNRQQLHRRRHKRAHTQTQ